MHGDRSELDAYLDEAGVDGYLIEADSTEADQYYLSGFDAPDPFLTLYDGAIRLFFARSLEFGRAKREADADTVERAVDFDYQALREEYGDEADDRVKAAFLNRYDVEAVAVPPEFPVSTADGLREQGIDVHVDDDQTVMEIRSRKTDTEIEYVRDAQRANEAAMRAAEQLLSEATVEDGTLHHGDEVLTSERVKEEIEITLLRHGCGLDETIVACGRDAADPHDRGSGPLAAGEPIIVDIFPRNKATKYHADMTRTFCVGDPDETVREWYDLTAEAHGAALAAVEPGATGADVHEAAATVYEDAGLPTLRSDPSTETGFIHSTGHGVGLDVHELPQVSPAGGELRPGHVITIEPGLYDPEVGGIRLEDLVVVTEDGYENLTDYPMSLSV
jgi:Xaa-Pro aminopeptidase